MELHRNSGTLQSSRSYRLAGFWQNFSRLYIELEDFLLQTCVSKSEFWPQIRNNYIILIHITTINAQNLVSEFLKLLLQNAQIHSVLFTLHFHKNQMELSWFEPDFEIVSYLQRRGFISLKLTNRMYDMQNQSSCCRDSKDKGKKE